MSRPNKMDTYPKNLCLSSLFSAILRLCHDWPAVNVELKIYIQGNMSSPNKMDT